MINWFELSIISLIFFSFGYMFSRLTPRGKYGTVKLIAVCGLVMGAHAVSMLLLDSKIHTFHLSDIITYFPASFCCAASLIVLIFALGEIRPFAGVGGIVAAGLCFLFGKTDSFGNNFIVNIAGTALILGGIVLVAACEYKNKKRSADTIALAAIFSVLRALGIFADGRITVKRGAYGSVAAGSLDETSALVSFELTFLAVALIALVFLLIKKEQLFDKKIAGPMIASGVCASFGSLAYFYSIGNQTARVASVVACAPVAAILWSRVFLKEKQPKLKYAALVLAAAGIAAYAFAG